MLWVKSGSWLPARGARSRAALAAGRPKPNPNPDLLQLVARDVGTEVAHVERALVQGPAHLQGPAGRDARQGLPVQLRLRPRRRLRAVHRHEAEAARHVVVIDEDLALDDLAVLLKQCREITGRERLGQPVHEERGVAPDRDGGGGGLCGRGPRDIPAFRTFS